MELLPCEVRVVSSPDKFTICEKGRNGIATPLSPKPEQPLLWVRVDEVP